MTRPRVAALPVVVLLVTAVAIPAAAVGPPPGSPAEAGDRPVAQSDGGPTNQRVEVSLSVTPGQLPLPGAGRELDLRRANGTLTNVTGGDVTYVDTLVVTLRAPNLTGRLVNYEGSALERLREHLAETDAAFVVRQTNPSPSRGPKRLHPLSDRASAGAVRVFSGRSVDTVHVAFVPGRVPATRDPSVSAEIQDTDRFAIGFRAANARPADEEFEPGDHGDTGRWADEARVVMDDPAIDFESTAVDRAGDPVLRYAPGDGPVPLRTTLAPGSRVALTVRATNGTSTGWTTTRRVRIDRTTAWLVDPRFSGAVPTVAFPEADAPYRITATVTAPGVESATERIGRPDHPAVVVPAVATLDVPRQRRDGGSVFVRNVSLSHGGQLVVETAKGEVLTTRSLPAGVHGRVFLNLNGTDPPRFPRVVAYRDVDSDGSLDPIDRPYRTNGSVVADTGEYVTPSPTPTPTPTATSRATETGTAPTNTQTVADDDRAIPGFGPFAWLLAALVALGVVGRRAID
jgi:hypothetical protein